MSKGNEWVEIGTQHLPLEVIQGGAKIILEATLTEGRKGILNMSWCVHDKQSDIDKRLTPEEATFLIALLNQAAARVKAVYGYVPPPEKVTYLTGHRDENRKESEMDQKEVDAKVKKMEQDWEKKDRLYREQLEAYIAMAKAHECVVCSVQGKKTQFLGGRNTTLCDQCLAAWHEYLASSALKGDYNDAQARFYVAIYQGSEEATMERNRAWQDVTDAIYELSGEWLKEEKME